MCMKIKNSWTQLKGIKTLWDPECMCFYSIDHFRPGKIYRKLQITLVYRLTGLLIKALGLMGFQNVTP